MTAPEVIKIDETDIFLQDLGPSQGKITVSNTWGYNYSMYWGSMGGDLKSFLKHINAGYFASKLLGAKDETQMDVRKTFTEIRKYIREEMRLSWYEHQEFQKDMRERLNSFQRECESEPNANYFVDRFNHFVKRLDFSLIKDRYDAKRMEEEFENITEPWHFIVDKPSQEYVWLTKLHKKLKKALK